MGIWYSYIGKKSSLETNSSGRLIMPGSLCYPYTDDPSGIRGWKKTGIPGLPDGYVDDSEGFHKGCDYREARLGDEIHYCEGSFYQTEDSVIHMMLRTDRDYLAVTESFDDGETWSEPQLTDYTDCQARFHFGRLPDGRYYGLSCPDPEGGRTPLVLATSEDGVEFDSHYVLGDEPSEGPRIPGHHKGGRYGYPYSHVLGERVYVIYSIEKEDIALRQFELGEFV